MASPALRAAGLAGSKYGTAVPPRRRRPRCCCSRGPATSGRRGCAWSAPRPPGPTSTRIVALALGGGDSPPHPLEPGRGLQRALDRLRVPDASGTPHWPGLAALRDSLGPGASSTCSRENRLILAHGMHRLLGVSRPGPRHARPRSLPRVARSIGTRVLGARVPASPLWLPFPSGRCNAGEQRAGDWSETQRQDIPLPAGSPSRGSSCSIRRTREGAWHSETGCRRARGVSCPATHPCPPMRRGRRPPLGDVGVSPENSQRVPEGRICMGPSTRYCGRRRCATHHWGCAGECGSPGARRNVAHARVEARGRARQRTTGGRAVDMDRGNPARPGWGWPTCEGKRPRPCQPAAMRCASEVASLSHG